MYFPSAWATVAGIIRDWGLALDALAANQSVPGGIAAELSFLKPDLSSIPSYAYEAISCGDAVDAGNMTMRDGFDTIVFASETEREYVGGRVSTVAMKKLYGPLKEAPALGGC